VPPSLLVFSSPIGYVFAATVAFMYAIVGDADSMEPFKGVRIRVRDIVRAHPFHEVMSVRTDPAEPRLHVMVRWVVPGTVITRTP
jgi:hypothetical protein